jgi:hypothetical protein
VLPRSRPCSLSRSLAPPLSRRQDLPRDVDGKIARAAQLKELGNEQFKAKAYKKAIGHYMQVGLFLTGPPFSGGDAGGGMAGMFGGSSGGSQQEKLTAEQQETVDQLMFTANLNLSACYLKEEKWEKATLRATKVLEKEPNHVKALFRRGEGKIYLNDLEGARADLQAAEKLAPEDKGIKSRLVLLAKREKHFEKKERQTYAKMFAQSDTKEAGEAAGEPAAARGGSGEAAAAAAERGATGGQMVGEVDTPAEGSVEDVGGGAAAGAAPMDLSDGGLAGTEGAPSPTGPIAAAIEDPLVAEALARVRAEGLGKGAAASGGSGGSSSFQW